MIKNNKKMLLYIFVALASIISNTLYSQVVKSISQLTKEAINNNVTAQCELGGEYLTGSDRLKQNFDKGFYWIKKAAENNNSEAQMMLALLYENGAGTVKDLTKSFYWNSKAANQQDPDAEYRLGVIYENGIGTDKDLKKSFEWYYKAANQTYDDDTNAKNTLARMYKNGLGTPVSIKQYEYWSKKANHNFVSECDIIFKELEKEKNRLKLDEDNVNEAESKLKILNYETNELQIFLNSYNPKYLKNGDLYIYDGFNLDGNLQVRKKWLLRNRDFNEYKIVYENILNEHNEKVNLLKIKMDDYNKNCFD